MREHGRLHSSHPPPRSEEPVLPAALPVPAPSRILTIETITITVDDDEPIGLCSLADAA